MSNNSKRVKRIVFAGLFFFVIMVIGVFCALMYDSKKDVSEDERYAKCLNIPFKLKEHATIRWNANNLRFKNYSLILNEASAYDTPEVKSVKIYQPGETVTFISAKSYSSLHVGTTYYLIGRDTLDTGEVIDFEYYYTGDFPLFE
ncbi:hypothetical protein [Olleya namhaensis]|uniref:hypothetical protein n=1 Tax=Olleya namhaensis TaxID=1144750 RepID=UPI0024911AD8|nr:hypothetical protein [Olleya namhaensis]